MGRFQGNLSLTILPAYTSTHAVGYILTHGLYLSREEIELVYTSIVIIGDHVLIKQTLYGASDVIIIEGRINTTKSVVRKTDNNGLLLLKKGASITFLLAYSVWLARPYSDYIDLSILCTCEQA